MHGHNRPRVLLQKRLYKIKKKKNEQIAREKRL